MVYRGVGKKERREPSLTALDKVGLSGRLDHRTGADVRRTAAEVAIARAIAQAPPIILADEPTGNLVPIPQEIMQILRAAQRGKNRHPDHP